MQTTPTSRSGTLTPDEHLRVQARQSLQSATQPTIRRGSHCSSAEDQLNSPLRIRMYQILRSSIVEYGMSFIILANFALIIAETDIRAQEEGDDAPQWMELASWGVLLLFIVELTMRLYVERWKAFRDPWNTFDFAVIAADCIFSLMAEIFSSILPISLLRILRLAKVARLSKVFRVFPELRLMLAGLLGAVRAIMWGTVLMGIALLMVSVLAVQFIHPLNQKVAETGVYNEANCKRCEDAFATVLDAALTFWQNIIAGDAWGAVTIPIIEQYPAAAFYFITVFLLMGLALHNLILGVVVDVAQESRKKLQREIDMRRNMMRMEGQENLLQMCSDMDTDKSGTLNKSELFQGYEDNENFRTALADLDVQESDLDVVWMLMDKNRSGSS